MSWFFSRERGEKRGGRREEEEGGRENEEWGWGWVIT
jgi:hypothetical protein